MFLDFKPLKLSGNYI